MPEDAPRQSGITEAKKKPSEPPHPSDIMRELIWMSDHPVRLTGGC